MRSLNPFFLALLISPALLAGCGSSDSNLIGDPNGDGGADTDGGGSGSGGGGGDETGGAGGDGAGGENTGGASGSGGADVDGGSGSGGATPDSGTGGATDGGDGGGVQTCDDIDCIAPATCDDSTGAAACVCPAGYEDVMGDGSLCLLENGGVCADGTECSSGFCVSGSCCAVECDSPGECQQLAGTVCVNGTTCEYGKQLDDTPCDDADVCTDDLCFDGACVGEAKDCADTSQCTTDTCDGVTGACVHTTINAAVVCNDGNPCTNDLCGANVGCRHTNRANTVACDDGNACTNDLCNNGVCRGTAIDCSSEDDDCNEGICVAGACEPQPANSGGACTQGLASCDATGACNASGVCVGDDAACGDLATSCASCTSGPNCFQNRLCTCETPGAGDPPINIINGVCVAATDECLVDPCDDIAIACDDPTPDGSVVGDVDCTCPAGYHGTGVGPTGCIDDNECLPAGSNPCGVGNGTCVNTAGSYNCTCAAGYTKIPGPNGPICRCDLSGTYAFVGTSMVSWSNVDPFGAIENSPPEGVPIYSWALRQQTIESDGTLTIQTIPCGGTSPTLCNTLQSQALAQYQPTQTWGYPEIYASTTSANLNTGWPTISMSLANVRPGGTYVEPEIAVLMGISLADRDGDWPPCADCVGGALNSTCTCGGVDLLVTNPAAWVDADHDTGPGVTTLAVPNGGLDIDGVFPDPPIDYPEPSECRRLPTPTNSYDYAAWPGVVPPFGFFNADEWFGGARVTSQAQDTSITFASNQCVISGEIIGPDGGFPKGDARLSDCSVAGQVSESCTAEQGQSYDDAAQSTQSFESSSFELHKLTAVDVTFDLAAILAMADGDAGKATALVDACQEVRELYCPAGMNCAP